MASTLPDVQVHCPHCSLARLLCCIGRICAIYSRTRFIPNSSIPPKEQLQSLVFVVVSLHPVEHARRLPRLDVECIGSRLSAIYGFPNGG